MGTTARSPGLSSITARQWMILLSVQLSSLLFGMTITLANVVLPQIRGALSATYDRLAGEPARLAGRHVQRCRRVHCMLAVVRARQQPRRARHFPHRTGSLRSADHAYGPGDRLGHISAHAARHS